MFLSKFLRRAGDEINVVNRVQAYTQPDGMTWDELDHITLADGKNAGQYLRQLHGMYAPRELPETINIHIPATVDGALLAHQIEHQLKRRYPPTWQ